MLHLFLSFVCKPEKKKNVLSLQKWKQLFHFPIQHTQINAP